MKRNRLVITAFFICLAGFLVQSYAQDDGISRDVKRTPLLIYLAKVGNANDCFFTLEEAELTDNTKMLSSQWVEQPTKETLQAKAVFANLNDLQVNIPELRYEVDERNPRIIHVLDSRLPKEKYGLDVQLTNFHFKGTIFNLIEAIKNQGISISTREYITSNDTMFCDIPSEGEIEVSKITVREALSNFILPEGCSRIIWVAKTQIGKGANGISVIHIPARSSRSTEKTE